MEGVLTTATPGYQWSLVFSTMEGVLTTATPGYQWSLVFSTVEGVLTTATPGYQWSLVWQGNSSFSLIYRHLQKQSDMAASLKQNVVNTDN
jgi:hypothetical protein